MKKTMIFAAVAAIFMFSSCQKEELTPGQDSQSEELVFTATIDQSATKTTINTDGTDATNRGKIEWVAGDEITITDAESMSVVYVAETSGASVSFKKKEGETGSLAAGSTYSATYKAAPATVQAYADYYSAVNQAKDLYMTALSTSGTTLSFTAACGLLKLNLTASGDNAKDISKIEIVGTPTGGSAAVYTLTCDNESIESAKDFYIALPAGSYDLMKFTNSKGSVCFKKATTAMAIEANKIQPVTLSGITFSALLPGEFTVASGKKVQFSAANLWCNASASPVTYSLESAQNVTYKTLGQKTYTADHVCHFYWSKDASVAYAQTYSDAGASYDDKFFCGEDNPMTIDSQSGLYALTGVSSGEWYYLFMTRNNSSSLYKKGVSVTTSAGTVANCVVIAPDEYTGSIASLYDAAAWAAAEASGLVCLPAAGSRYGSSPDYVGSYGYYWSSTLHSSYSDYAYALNFSSGLVFPAFNDGREYGYSVRLVYTAAPSAPVYPEAPALACVKIGDVWWAPVNCGYDATNAPTGLFYQWGRKYGQSNTKEMTDADFITTQATSMTAGNTEANKDKFYKENQCWFTGNTTSDTWSSEYDPCPAGWRIPTKTELSAIKDANKEWTSTGGPSSNQTGYKFGTSPNQVFFPATGCRDYSDGSVINDHTYGYYWSSSPDSSNANKAGCLYFIEGYESVGSSFRANGYSVRCVQE